VEATRGGLATRLTPPPGAAAALAPIAGGRRTGPLAGWLDRDGERAAIRRDAWMRNRFWPEASRPIPMRSGRIGTLRGSAHDVLGRSRDHTRRRTGRTCLGAISAGRGRRTCSILSRVSTATGHTASRPSPVTAQGDPSRRVTNQAAAGARRGTTGHRAAWCAVGPLADDLARRDERSKAGDLDAERPVDADGRAVHGRGHWRRAPGLHRRTMDQDDWRGRDPDRRLPLPRAGGFNDGQGILGARAALRSMATRAQATEGASLRHATAAASADRASRRRREPRGSADVARSA
jgi:hypothetical protein